MKERIQTYKFVENPDGTVGFLVQPLLCLNNIGQRLHELIEDYRFFYLGLEAPDVDVQKFRRTVELGFPLAGARDMALARRSAKALLNKNFVINLIEISNEELVQIILLLVHIRLADSKTRYKDYPEAIRKETAQLARSHLPELVAIVEKEVGPCSLKDCLLSVNKVRRAFVHCGGSVDGQELTLRLRLLSLMGDYSLETLANPATSPKITNETMTFKDYAVTWHHGEVLEIDYGMCVKMVVSVMSYFAEIINVRTLAKYPWTDTERQGTS